MEAGTYEVGVETVRADSLAAAGRETLYEHPGSGAATELVEIVRRDRMEPTTADEALGIGEQPDGGPVLMVNTQVEARRGRCCRRRRACSTTAACRNACGWCVPPGAGLHGARPSSTPPTGGQPTETDWRALWEDEIAGLPSHRESRFWLAAGLLLPVWDRLPAENMRVRRLDADDGEP